ncbi:IS3 family transposase [Enterococcus faecium]|uniref:IS3 family transposase n=1 Tax=Enterococcus faecium TaxID=1352 RepID=UPI0032ED9605
MREISKEFYTRKKCLKQTIENYIYYYNHYRIKEKFNWQIPIEFRKRRQRKA